MHDFGDGHGHLIVKGPWEAPLLIIWIQLLVVFLLLCLIFSSFPEHRRRSSSSSIDPFLPSTDPLAAIGLTAAAGRCISRQVGGDNPGSVCNDILAMTDSSRAECETFAISPSVDEGHGRDRETEDVGLDQSSSSSFEEEETRGGFHHHPCNLMKLAIMAFIKCFGLESR